MLRHSVPLFVATLAASALASAVACQGGGSASHATGSPDAQAEGGIAFQADPATVYVAKVKNILVGLPPTDAEIQAVEADPTQLGPLIDGWMLLPQYQQKMLRFFQLAFQQTQVTYTAIRRPGLPQADRHQRDHAAAPHAERAGELRAHDARSSSRRGSRSRRRRRRTQFMMTTAMKELYAFLDQYEVDDNRQGHRRLQGRQPRSSRSPSRRPQGPIPIPQTLDPTSPNYMHWYDPDVATANSSGRRAARRIPSSSGPASGDAPLPPLRLARRTQDAQRRHRELPTGRGQRGGAAAPDG